MKIEVTDRIRGVRPRAVQVLGIGLVAWLVLAPGAASAAGAEVQVAASEQEALVAPPETNLTFNEDVRILKAVPALTLFDTTAPDFFGLIVSVTGGQTGGIQFRSSSNSQGLGRLFEYAFSTADLTFQPVSRFNDNVGIGVYPTEKLHVRGGQGQARLLLEEINSTVIGRNLLRLVNNGPATFRFENNASGAMSSFGSIVAQDKFFISRVGGSGLNLTLDGAGNLVLLGTLTQLSDRNAKRDVEAVDGRALLERIGALPLATWSYKADARGTRHIGPMAQDFAAAFGLGADETHVAPSDVAGVGLAAVQALKRENDELRAALGQLSSQLSERLDALEGRAAQAVR